MTTAVFAPTETSRRAHEPVGDWKPARYTDTLTGTDEFTSAADGLLIVVMTVWRSTEGPLELDPWQVWLLRRMLETYPEDWPVEHLRGRLRYKRLLISMGRQNGKSVIAAILALYLLVRHVPGPKVGGFASIESQAGIVYDRLRFAIDNSPQLSERLKTTKTRGIEYRDGTGSYNTFPAKEDSLQGEPFSGAIYDELHLGDMALWDAIVLGQRSKPGAILAGFTTAGDDESLLLKRLYDEADDALAGDDERMGVFIWESATDEFGADYVPTPADVIAGNPAIACGRIPLDEAMADVLKMWRAGPDEKGVTGRDRVIRYTMNRFVEGAADAWVPAVQYNALRGLLPDDLDTPPVYGLQRTEDWEHATITANYAAGGRLYSSPVATIERPTQEILLRACRDLANAERCAFAMPAKTLRPLMKALRDDGHEAWALGHAELQQAYATVRGAVKTRTLTHAGDPLTRLQSSRAKPRKTEDGTRLSSTLSVGEIDALEALHAGVFVASIREDSGLQLF
ncbi:MULTISPECIES: terminase large subunit domain-containing protein [unclassified Aeromicrobium]|uniref:terminase large subunit domain-containing protein n=1 Tax=unclassified Aeromicrobium TaxID=2633570 RepID=UPI002889E22E|nr:MULTISPECIES: terminase large subunit [unclassified Aeromicrobium]